MSRKVKTNLLLATALLIMSAIGFAPGQGGDPRNTNKPSSTPTTSKSTTPVMPRKYTNRTGIDFVLISPGSFMMGSTNHEDEKPVHQVTIKYWFYMGKFEVTQAQWQTVMPSRPSKFKDCVNCPVEQVTWDEAKGFVQKLNQLNDGYKYRLPSEAEWEYACRAGTNGEYAGDVNAMAWFSENSENETHSVGSKRANAWGLYDMHGNVREWCEDRWHATYHGAPSDGSAWLSGGEFDRVLRSGSWQTSAADLRSASRLGPLALATGSDIGFRVVAVARTK